MTCAAQVMVLLLVLGDPSSHLCTIALQSSAVSQDKCKAEHVLCECLLLDAANAMATWCKVLTIDKLGLVFQACIVLCWQARPHRQAVRAGAVQPGEEKAPRLPAFLFLKGRYRKEGDRLFSGVCGDGTRGNDFKLKEGRFRLDRRKMFLQWRWWGTGTDCPEMWLMPCPRRLWRWGWIRPGATWSSCACPCSLQGSWTRWPVKVSFKYKCSMILWSSLLLVQSHHEAAVNLVPWALAHPATAFYALDLDQTYSAGRCRSVQIVEWWPYAWKMLSGRGAEQVRRNLL